MGLSKVICVGAGPSGLLLALLLAKNGINVELFDADKAVSEQPRAAHYAPPAVAELRRAGVYDDVASAGYMPRDFTWRKPDGTPVASMYFDVITPEEDRMVVLPLNHLCKILYSHLEAQPSAKVQWNHKVVDIGQDGDKAWVVVETPEGRQRHEADYIIGCDGANSQVRRSLFGDLNYPGETLNAQIIATNVYYDFPKYGYSDTNYFIHPTNWHMVAKITNDGLYRVSYAEVAGLSNEEYLERQPRRYQELLPGAPKPGEYKIVNISPYKMQQRCAPSFRVGRFILAADAAHLCNPFGGLGLTGGIADVGSLFDCLDGIHKGLASDSILDKYADIRRKIWEEVTNPSSRENFKRLHDQDADTAGQNDPLFQLCHKAETDKNLARELCLGLNILRHDFTQYYDKPAG